VGGANRYKQSGELLPGAFAVNESSGKRLETVMEMSGERQFPKMGGNAVNKSSLRAKRRGVFYFIQKGRERNWNNYWMT
jgi:hypothetical protein